MNILNPTPFIEGGSDPWGGQGPQAAAAGNIGGLQQALVRPQQPRPPVFSQNAGNEIESALLSRIRSPEKMEEAEGARRGALNQLMQAYRQPEDDATFDTYLNEALMQLPGSAAEGMGPAIGYAMKAGREKQGNKRKGEIEALKAQLGFEVGEESSASKEESTALANVTRGLISQSKGAGTGSATRGAINVPGVGLVDVTQRDPETGQILPKVLLSQDAEHKARAEGRRQAQIAANGLAARDAFKSVEEYNQFIDAQTEDYVHAVAGQKAESKPQVAPVSISPSGGTKLASAAELIESGRKQSAVSPKGATGVMQVMEGTGPEAAKLAGLPWDKEKWQKDENYNRLIGTAYLEAQQQKYGNDVHALAAYNWGPDRVDKWLETTGGDPRKLPDETRRYIGDVMTAQMMRVGKEEAPAPTQPATQTQPAQVSLPLSSPVGSTPLSTRAEREGAAKQAVVKEENIGKQQLEIDRQAEQARGEIDTVDSVMALRPKFTPSSMADFHREAARHLSALGVNNYFTQEGNTLDIVDKRIKASVNDKMSQENGVQARDDTVRFREAQASIKDPAMSFDFNMSIMKEINLRKLERQQLYREKGTEKGAEEWDKYRRTELGPMFTHTDSGKFMFRHQFVDLFVHKNQEKYPDKDPDELRQVAIKNWDAFAANQDRKFKGKKNANQGK